jgi:hypothetical protein
MLILLALTFQEELSGWRLERALEERERGAVVERIADILRRPGVEELAAMAGRLVVKDAVERPVYHVRVATLVERRSVEVEWTPTSDPKRAAKPLNVDAWAPPTPAHGPEGGRWTVAIPESEQVADCAECEGSGKEDCAACAASGSRPCKKCRGKGEENCGPCHGTGKTNCTTCGGDGRRGMGSDRKRCSWCSGTGKKDCSSCSNGRVKCGLCKGRKTVECIDCDGDGETACESCKGKGRKHGLSVIRITIAPTNSPEVFTKLSGAPPAATPAWSGFTREEFAARAAEIPDEGLRNAILAHASRERAVVPAKQLRGQRILICRVACVEVEYEVDRTDYRVVLAPTGVTFEDWPGARWAAAKAFEAGAKLEAGELDGAERLARESLRVWKTEAAERVIAGVTGRREAKAMAEAEVARVENERRAEVEFEERRQRETRMFAIVGVVIGAGLTLAVGLFIWRAVMRARWSGGVVIRR